MKWLKIIFLLLVIGLIGIQFIPNKMPVNSVAGQDDLIKSGVAGGEIAGLLKTSCYDCHSNETHFPWYAKVAPASWLLSNDIRKGRSELNFSEWGSYRKRRQIGKLESIKEQVTSGEMPIPAYTLIHRKAVLSPGQMQAIAKWADEVTAKMLQ